VTAPPEPRAPTAGLPPSLQAWARAARAQRARRIPRVLAPDRAAVAVVLRENAGAVEVLLSERAQRPGDPWSGQMAFPGGRAEPHDRDEWETASRETREEIGLDLDTAALALARLPELQALAGGRRLGLAIAPLLYALPQPKVQLTPDAREVADAVWVPLAALNHQNRGRYLWRRILGLVPIELPCWRVGGHTIWGLTYRMLSELLALRPADDDSATETAAKIAG